LRLQNSSAIAPWGAENRFRKINGALRAEASSCCLSADVAVLRALQLIVFLFRSAECKRLETVVLRQELTVLRGQARRPAFASANRVFLAVANRMLPRIRM